MIQQRTAGFILPLTVIIIFTISALVVRFMKEISLAVPETALIRDREQAKQVAMMGVDLLQAQLAYDTKDEKNKKAFYERLFGVLNRWSRYTLNAEVDGVDAELYVYVACESGKVPLNALWDFKAKKYATKEKLETKKILEPVILKKQQNGKSSDLPIAAELENFLKTQKYPLEDVTALFVDPSFQGLTQPFFTQPLPEKNSPAPFTPVLGDLFSTAHDELAIQPAFLSSTAGQIFGLKPEGFQDEKKREEFIKKLSGQKNDSLDWSKQWDELLAPIYNKKYESLPAYLKQLFAPAIGASLISVVSYGKVGTVTQKIRVELVQDTETKDRVTYKIRKFYWL